MGQIVGQDNGHITIWNSITKTETDLGTGGAALSINNLGQVAGWSDYGTEQRATVWNTDGTVANLGDPWGGSGSFAYAINNTGQVAGLASAFRPSDINHEQGSVAHATLWSGGVATDLGTLGGYESFAYGINDSGQVVGNSLITDLTANHATLWDHGTVTDLGAKGLRYSSAYDINNAGKVVGVMETQDIPNALYQAHATIWDHGAITDLGTLDGVYRSRALAINNFDLVVGSSETSTAANHATLWDHGTAIDLNNFLDASMVSAGWVLVEATGINDNGWIVGYATERGTSRAFLLSLPIPEVTIPVPEPETYALFMAGLGLMGFIARRRKNDQA
jgi:probable HAF family extracellular repeat protein